MSTNNSEQYSSNSNQQDKNRGEWTLSRVMTRSAWLHIKDALEIGKFRIYIGNYQRGKGAKAQATAYVDVDAFRLVLQDLALRGELPSKFYKKNCAEFYGGSERDGQLEARIFKVSDRSEMNCPIIFEISYGPGKRNFQGGIQPAGKMQSVSIMLDRQGARKLASAVLSELQAWQAATVMSRRRQSEQESLNLKKSKSESSSSHQQHSSYAPDGPDADFESTPSSTSASSGRSRERGSRKSKERGNEQKSSKRKRSSKSSEREQAKSHSRSRSKPTSRSRPASGTFSKTAKSLRSYRE